MPGSFTGYGVRGPVGPMSGSSSGGGAGGTSLGILPPGSGSLGLPGLTIGFAHFDVARRFNQRIFRPFRHERIRTGSTGAAQRMQKGDRITGRLSLLSLAVLRAFPVCTESTLVVSYTAFSTVNRVHFS
jgi:hypothetical protein